MAMRLLVLTLLLAASSVEGKWTVRGRVEASAEPSGKQDQRSLLDLGSFLEGGWKGAFAKLGFEVDDCDLDQPNDGDNTKDPTPSPSPTPPTTEPTSMPIPDPTPAPTATPSPTADPQNLLDKELLVVAKAVTSFGLDAAVEDAGEFAEFGLTSGYAMTYQAQVESFEMTESPDEAQREELQKNTLIGISYASAEQLEDLVNPESEHYSNAIHRWNDAGALTDENNQTQRSLICDIISDPISMASTDVRECMCGDTEPFIQCQLMLGSGALKHHARRQRERRLGLEQAEEQTDLVDIEEIARTCSISSDPPNLMGGDPTLKTLLQSVTDDPKGISMRGSCGFDLSPPPLNILEIVGEVDVRVPDLPWMTKSGALNAIRKNTLPSPARLKQIVQGVKGRLSGAYAMFQRQIRNVGYTKEGP